MRTRELRLLGLVAFLIFFYTWMVVLPDEGHGPHVKLDHVFFWMQMLSGSAWPEWKDYTDSPFWLAIGATLQVMIGAGPAIAVLWIVVRIMTNRSNKMNLTVVLSEHDAALKASILSLISRTFGEDAARKLTPGVRDIFRKEQADLLDKVERIWGKDAREEVSKRISELV
ncbi:hypothetical protein [Paraburkholderia sp. GAS348]|uniref:hypothetical protein n=1 Tax=Paraburkholderia sp. GAS348 TaxID=3035132 RepID=UPI003D24D361